MKRACGVLLPLSSLPGNFGIGTFSKDAYDFVDFLKKTGQSYWQILPLAPTGYGDSPYQSISAFAGNANYISLEYLIYNHLLDEEEVRSINWGTDEKIDYGILWENREKLLYKAFLNFLDEKYIEDEKEDKKEALKLSKNIKDKKEEGTEAEKIKLGEDSEKSVKKEESPKEILPYEEKIFTKDEFFILKGKLPAQTKEFCLFQAIKKRNDYKPWYEWENGLRLRKTAALEKFKKDEKELILFYRWIQVLFNSEWKKIKKYANERNIEIIGDMPIYVSLDSSDSWANEKLFAFDEDKMPKRVAGCPPDYFSPEGQLWGNPIYDWEYHKSTKYAWWKERFDYNFSLYDYVRMDHFRGFDEYYSVDATSKNAKEGKWEKGPGLEIFDAVKRHFKDRFESLPIIAEDMGLLTDSVIKMVEKSGFPSMKVLEFAFDSDSRNFYLPHNYERNCVAYTGTHDNTTLRAWIDSLNHDTKQYMIRYLGAEHTPHEDLHLVCIRTLFASVADTVIVPMQDYLGLGEFARLNTPGSLGENWRWRLKKNAINEGLIWHMNLLAGMYSRS